MILFADDSALICSEENIQSLSKTKAKIDFAKLKTGLNQIDWHSIIKKSNCMLFNSSSNKTDKFCLASNNRLFKSQNAIKYFHGNTISIVLQSKIYCLSNFEHFDILCTAIHFLKKSISVSPIFIYAMV